MQPASLGECLLDLRGHQPSLIFLSISADWRGKPTAERSSCGRTGAGVCREVSTLLRARPDVDTAPNTAGLRLGDLL